MNKYELTIRLESKASAAKKKKIEDLLEKITAVFKGKLGKMEDWGEIGAGVYLHFPLELKKETVKGVSTKLNQEKEIKKYLLVVS